MEEISKEIIERAKDGDKEAMSEIFEMYKDYVMRSSYIMLGRVEEAEDVTENVFFKIFTRIQSFDIERDFRPYSTNGYWTMTQYGNTWVSHYPWGWAPFHYGRWVYTSYRGWGWIPGYEWGPAWVEWRSGNGYYYGYLIENIEKE